MMELRHVLSLLSAIIEYGWSLTPSVRMLKTRRSVAVRALMADHTQMRSELPSWPFSVSGGPDWYQSGWLLDSIAGSDRYSLPCPLLLMRHGARQTLFRPWFGATMTYQR